MGVWDGVVRRPDRIKNLSGRFVNVLRPPPNPLLIKEGEELVKCSLSETPVWESIFVKLNWSSSP